MTLLTLFPYALDSNVLSFMVVWDWYTRPRKGKRVTLGGKGEHHRYVYMHSNIVSVAQHCPTKREGLGTCHERWNRHEKFYILLTTSYKLGKLPDLCG